MGKLKVFGKARKTYECDIMIVKLDFTSSSSNTSGSVETSQSQCDCFLQYLSDDCGINIDSIHISDNRISQDVDEDEFKVHSTKSIELYLPFDMPFLNGLTDIIKKFSFEIEMDISFKLSNMIEIHNQLIKDAVVDSRKKAEMIAETMNQKVIGIEELNAGDRYRSDSEEREYYDQFCHKLSATHSVSNKLRAPLITEYESVEVVWIIE